MKRSSLQWKLTLWFSAALVLMAVLTFIVVFFVSHSVLQKQLRTELIHTGEDNVDEVEFYRSVTQMELDGSTDHYIRYGVGYLQRLLIVHGVYAAHGYEQYVYMAHGFKGSFVRQVAYVAHMGKAQSVHLEYEYDVAAPLRPLHFVMPAGYAGYLYIPDGILAGG